MSTDDFNPSWIEDGYGISGPQDDYTEEDLQPWDLYAGTQDQQSGPDYWSTKVTSKQNKEPEDFIGGSADGDCMAAAGDPPGSGTFVLGSVDGTCQWIDTTTCS